jgi:glycosyltransferase involved in cell wall biosynthesis
VTKHIGTSKAKRDFLHRWLYQRVDYLIAISEVIRQNLIATHPISASQVGVVHHGIDLHDFFQASRARDALREELGFSRDQIVFGIIGRLQIGKGYLEFLEMAHQIGRLRPRARFLMVGEATRGEPEEANLILNKIEHPQLRPIVKWVGFRKDVPRLLAAMDVFVFPSHAEAFGLVLIEAMAAGKPVISSNCDGVLEIVRHGETGFLVAPRDVAALTEAAERLLQDEALRQKMGEAGRRLAAEAFSVERTLENIEALYQRFSTRA